MAEDNTQIVNRELTGEVSVMMLLPLSAKVVAAAVNSFAEVFPHGTIDAVVDKTDLKGDNRVLQREITGKALVFRLPPPRQMPEREKPADRTL